MTDETIEIVLFGKPPEPPPLRSIGTEFEHRFPPDLTTTDWERGHKWSVYTYRVVAHRLIARFPGDTGQVKLEEIELVKRRYEEVDM